MNEKISDSLVEKLLNTSVELDGLTVDQVLKLSDLINQQWSWRFPAGPLIISRHNHKSETLCKTDVTIWLKTASDEVINWFNATFIDQTRPGNVYAAVKQQIGTKFCFVKEKTS